MSNWHEVNDPEDVSYDHNDNTVNIILDPDDFGNRYVSIPVEFIINELSKYGYSITQTD